MKSALGAFDAEIKKLRLYLGRVKAETEIFGAIGEVDAVFSTKYASAIDTLIKTATNNRRYGYFLSIIVMYGALERFVEDAAQEYVLEVSTLCNKYEELPEALRTAHVSLSIEHLWLLQSGKMQDKSDIPGIIERLAGGVDGATFFALNAKAFTLRSGNMSFDRVKSIFKNIGVALIPKRVASAGSFKESYEALYGTPLDLSSSTVLDRVFSRIDDLVSIRNNIAHGVIDTDQIEELDLIEERVADIENFVLAITAVLEQEVLLFCFSHNRMIPLGPLIKVFNNEIVCVEFTNGVITVGDIIAVLTGDATDPIRYGAIISLQVDGVDIAKVTGIAGQRIGMKVDFRAKDSGEYFALPTDLRQLMR
jgi:RiboL-PSP-HEPN